MVFGWSHQHDIERTPRDYSHAYNGYIQMAGSLPRMNQTPDKPDDVSCISRDPNVELPSATTPTVSDGDESPAIRRFL